MRAGHASERLGPRVIIVGSLALSTVAVLASGFVLNSLWAFGACWCVLGLFRTTYCGAQGGYISTVVPQEYRTMVTGMGRQ
jgi:sugar phosphate permease